MISSPQFRLWASSRVQFLSKNFLKSTVRKKLLLNTARNNLCFLPLKAIPSTVRLREEAAGLLPFSPKC